MSRVFFSQKKGPISLYVRLYGIHSRDHGVPEPLIDWVRMLYDTISSRINCAEWEHTNALVRVLMKEVLKNKEVGFSHVVL